MKKICVSLSAAFDWETIKKSSLRMDELGYHSVWFGDHLISSGRGPAHARRFECWTLMSALMPLLDNLRVGSLVLSNSFRNPALLAKMGASLDVISGGRLEMGIGGGWNQEEYEAYGYEYPPPWIRLRQMEEGIRIMKLMWTEEKPSFEGKFYRIKDTVCEPKPIQKPYPPITIGGAGEKLTLRIVAKEAERCNFFGSPERVTHLLKVLRVHCEAVGRSYDEVEKSIMPSIFLYKDEQKMQQILKKIYQFSGTKLEFDQWVDSYKNRVIFGTVEDCIERLKEYDDLGVTCYMMRFEDSRPFLPRQDGFELFNEHVLDEIQ